jgi:glycosyltransferase involved in cell wall biosynthesis
MKSLYELYREHQGKVSDKWSIYLSEYDRLFSSYREQPIRMLEIGIQNGGSLEIWSKYFQNANILVGCDINPDCAKLTYEDNRIHVVVNDANSDVAEDEIFGHSKVFDLIIDDGSHTSGDIVKSFARYFHCLSDGGIFIAEDLHCSYWSDFEGGLYFPYSSISFFKKLADVINHEHWGIKKERKQLLLGFSNQFGTEFDEGDLQAIHSIEFFNSFCVVHKRQSEFNTLGSRFIAGNNEFVVSGHHKVLGDFSVAQPQFSNSWSTMDTAPEEDWGRISTVVSQRDSQLAERDAQLAERNSQIMRLSHEIAALRNSTSWRLTAPFRFFINQLASVNNLLRIPFRAARIGGGFRATLFKAFGLYRREGLSGIKRGIRIAQTRGKVIPVAGSDAFDRNDYSEWVRRYDTLDEVKRVKLQTLCDGLTAKPKISVLMPTYNPKPEWLIEAIESVREQIYPNWELCIADDASSDPAIRPILEKYLKLDQRIKIVLREKNGHISEASNSALGLATGQWTALLDHDDLLPKHALFWVAHCINNHFGTRLIYSDEDKIDEHGGRSSPYFKSDWNQDLFYSHNMFSHLGVYETELVKSIGGFRKGFEGAQDYDLALRCIEAIEPKQIQHIPRVLYHWRVHAESTAMSADSKPYAMIAGERAINEHLQRISTEGSVKLIGYGYEAKYKLPTALPLVSIIIPTRNGLTLLKRCIDSIFSKTTYTNFEILVVDNGSNDPATISYLKNSTVNSKIRVIREDSPFNYSRLNNLAVEQATGEIIALLNNDIEVISPEWLSNMVSHALRPEIGAVGAKLWYANDTLQHGGITLGVGGVAGHAHRQMPKGHSGYFGRAALIQNFSAVTAACLVIRKSTYLQVGGLNEVELAIGYNDVDFCLRVREAGYRNVWTPLAELYHHESATRGSDQTSTNKARLDKEVLYMKQRWGTLLLNDPAYSPNLTLNGDDFSYAWPPRIETVL